MEADTTAVEDAARAARDVARVFWNAVRMDDSATAVSLLSAIWAGGTGPIETFAETYRQERGLRPADLLSEPEWASAVEVLAGDRLRFFITPTSEVGSFNPGQPFQNWRLELVLEDGSWLIDRSSRLDMIASVELAD